MICADRSIELHAQYGRHFKIRTPKVGRDLIYAPPSAELVVGGSSHELWRLNLEEGRFMRSFDCGEIGEDLGLGFGVNGVNCLGWKKGLSLVFGGTDDGRVCVFDARQKDKGTF